MGGRALPAGCGLLHSCPQGSQLAQERPPWQPDRRLRRPCRARDGIPVHNADEYPVDPRHHRPRLGHRRAGLAPGQDDPDAAARRPVQRCRRRRGGNRGPAGTGALDQRLRGPRYRVHAARRRGVLLRLDRDLPEAAGDHHHPPADLPRPALGDGTRAGGRTRCRRLRRGDRVVRGCRSAAAVGSCRWCAARAAGRRCGRADRDLAAERLHRTDGRRLRTGARQRAAARRRNPRRRQRYDPHPGDGLGDGSEGQRHHLRCLQGRIHRRFH